MTPDVLELRLGSQVLNAVPSVHDCYPFAERVNELCATPATRPDAIAVELPPLMAAEVRAWMVELGAGPDQRTDLPAMLALVHPRLPDDNGANRSGMIDLCCLTPTDSIVEAVRCAVELDVPVYGIDLQLSGVRARRATAVMADPFAACGGVDEYSRCNETYAAHVRDPRVDAPREHAMASRLKFLLGHHKRVLMVCGLAHWAPLQELLLDTNVLATTVKSIADIGHGRLKRVVVHPIVALPYMDRFPAVVEAYQQSRRHPGLPDDGAPRSPIDPTSVYARLIQLTDEAYFMRSAKAAGAASDWSRRADFESFLTHLCIVDQRRVPNASTVLTAADGIMSREYRRRLAGVLLRYPWASPRDERFSALPVLVPRGPRNGTRFVMVDGRGRRGEEVGIGSWFGDQADPLDVEVPWDWADERPEWVPPSDMVLNWPPIGRLVTALSLQAMEHAQAEARLPRVEMFAGALRDGLALKATLRAQAQGRDEWFVREHVRQRRGAKRSQDRWDPVVWLFSLRPQPRAEWMVLAEELDELLPLARRPDEMRAVQRERGTVVVEQIGYGTRTWAFGRRASIRGGHSMYEWGGMLIYLPTHFTFEPTARFIESTQFRSTPIVAYEDPTSPSAQRLHQEHAVVQLFRGAYGMALDLLDWPTTLIRMAIPFAHEAVTVIAPDLFSIPSIARNEASQRGVIIRSVPHSAFPRERLSAISTWYGAQAVAGTLGTEFPEATERLFGEPASANSHLLPPYWRHYGVVVDRGATNESPA